MKKIYKISLLFVILIFLSTYNSKTIKTNLEENNTFFKIKNIKIENNSLISEKQIIKELEDLFEKNIFLINRSDIVKPLNNIDFLEKIEVKKKYPDTIIIKIFETKPLGYLINKNIKYLLDSSANLILLEENKTYGQLPNIFGEGAENNFIVFFNYLKKNNFPNEKIINFYYFKIGRWDIQLIDNKIIKFPNNNIEDAIKKSIELLGRNDFKNYNIIDLRINDKIIVE